MPNYGSYNNGNAFAQNDGVGVPSVGAPAPLSFGGDMADFMKNALREQYERRKIEQAQADEDRRRMIAAQQQAEVNAKLAAGARNGAPRASMPFQAGGQQEVNRGNPQLRALEEGARIRELQDQMSGPPVRYVTGGPGIVGGGLTLDTMRMSPGQRQAFLPQNSQAQDRTSGSAIGSDEFAGIDQRNYARRNGRWTL